MKFIVQLILIALFTYVGQFFLPWWGVFFLAGSVGMMVPSKGFSTFLAGFLAVALLWFLQVYLIDAANESILSTKVAAIVTLSSPMQLMLVTAVIGGVCGGFGVLTGTFLADMLKKKKEVHTVYS
jgi:hypothetical protein